MDSDEPAVAPDQQFIDDIYEIALDPGNLEGFFDRLESEAADVAQTREELLKVEALSAMFRAHLSRAEAFLDRVKVDSNLSPAATALASFEHSAAFLVEPSLRVLEANAKATSAFQIAADDPVDELPFEEEDLDQLVVLLRRLLRDQSSQSALAHLRVRDMNGRDGAVVVLHARWVALHGQESEVIAGRKGHVLLVSTELAWPDALDQTLHEVFGLTEAERDIVRALVEGKVLKTIARDRDRSVGTVRVQLKSILAKTRAKSQSELIRVTLSLMEIIKRAPDLRERRGGPPGTVSAWPTVEFSPYQSLRLPNGRNIEYLVQGDPSGKPIVFSHMGYGLLRWPKQAIELACHHQLKVIAPVRPGFGNTDTVGKNDDILKVIREDTASLLDHLGVERCPYVVQGNDMLFAVDFALNYRQRVSNLVGLGVRLPLPSHLQYPGMGKWHRFLLSNARHAPHLLYFTCKAAFTLGKKIGREELFRNVHKHSPADLAVANDAELAATLIESSKLALSDTHSAAFVYAKELLETESNWQDKVHAARDIPMWFVSGMQDPLSDATTIAAYQQFYPWIQIEILGDAGQLLFFQKYRELVPRIAEDAHRA